MKAAFFNLLPYLKSEFRHEVDRVRSCSLLRAPHSVPLAFSMVRANKNGPKFFFTLSTSVCSGTEQYVDLLGDARSLIHYRITASTG